MIDIFSLESYNYKLPQSLIANCPAVPRDSSRLMVVNRASRSLEHRPVFADILAELDDSWVIVRNNSAVYPARLVVARAGQGTLCEMMFTRTLGEGRWEVICRGLKRVRLGDVFVFFEGGQRREIRVVDVAGADSRMVDVGMDKAAWLAILETAGLIPLPPYIDPVAGGDYRRDYQTIYARSVGSIAAPTAGLHFTGELEERLQAKGVAIIDLTLHVGMGTFAPVRTEDIREHQIHSEQYEIGLEQLERLNEFKRAGRRVLAVGTTSTRLLESLAGEDGWLRLPDNKLKRTDIFIYPGYNWRFVDALVTNFHLPRSTLLMLVAAWLGRDAEAVRFLQDIYQEAIKQKYRFYSFGDAMLIR